MMGSMILEVLATLCAGLFAGAAIYINAVEHPARLACGTALAVREFAPSYHRATVMQASLAVVGLLASVGAWWRAGHGVCLVGGLLLGAVVPFTLLGILPTNRRLLAPSLDPDSLEAAALLRRWGRLHAVRSVLGGVAFGILLVGLVRF
jgi:anthrone oxygenase-like protein